MEGIGIYLGSNSVFLEKQYAALKIGYANKIKSNFMIFLL